MRVKHLYRASRREINFFTMRWGEERMLVSTGDYSIINLSCIVYEEDEELLGLLSYIETNDVFEIISLDSKKENEGIGSELLNALEERAKDANKRIQLITTNDNVRAIKFYEHRGYKLTHIFEGAVDKAREIKSSIPLVENGIEIHDEYLFVKNF